MPCPFTGPNIFLPDQKFDYILWQSQTFCASQKDDLHSVKLDFVATQKFLGWLKIFGRVQNILGPVKGQGKSLWIFFSYFVLLGKMAGP